jgi:hypothetical protein
VLTATEQTQVERGTAAGDEDLDRDSGDNDSDEDDMDEDESSSINKLAEISAKYVFSLYDVRIAPLQFFAVLLPLLLTIFAPCTAALPRSTDYTPLWQEAECSSDVLASDGQTEQHWRDDCLQNFC